MVAMVLLSTVVVVMVMAGTILVAVVMTDWCCFYGDIQASCGVGRVSCSCCGDDRQGLL